MNNIFKNPKKYLKEFYQQTPFKEETISSMIDDFKGLSMMCVWLTKLCPLQCEKCFFRSNMNHDGLKEEEYKFTDKGMDRLISFINASNNGYLMLSGGGDPMVYPRYVERLISETETRRIVIVTSGFWGNTYQSAVKYLDNLYDAFKSRVSPTTCDVVIRLSVDCYHEKELGGNEAYKNVIKAYLEKYVGKEHFSLMIHTMRDDRSIFALADALGGAIEYGELGESDNASVIKIVPQKALLKINSYEIPVGISKLFMSDLMVDINPPISSSVRDAVRVMTDDMENSEQGNPSYIQNSFGRKGLDFWVDYNGNVTTWFNQDWHQLFNLYSDNYQELVRSTFSNPMTAYFLRKGYENRNNIVAEVNPLALLRAQAVNLRDYFAAFLLEEEHTKLYYAIRTVQSFLGDYFISEEDLSVYSPELSTAIKYSVQDLKELYFKSEYDILEQYLDETTFDKEKWEDIFLLISLGHYKVSKERLETKIAYYNLMTGSTFSDVNDFGAAYNQNLYFRLHKRVSFMKPEAYKLLYSHK